MDCVKISEKCYSYYTMDLSILLKMGEQLEHIIIFVDQHGKIQVTWN